jgi:hypothetical protein
MPETNKPDWKEIVRERLPLPSSAQDAIPEIAAHLEDTYDEALAEGLTAPAAIEFTLQQIEDWRGLGKNICRAKCKEGSMNSRTKTFWLPAIAVLFATGVALVLLDRAAVLQRLIWIACTAMFLCTLASEMNSLNQRTRRFWLPGFVSLSAAILFLFAADSVSDPFLFFAQVSLHPQDVLRWNSGSPSVFYLVWLFAQVAFGAIGAIFSARMGGSRVARIAAGAFPAIVIALPAIVIVGSYAVLVPMTNRISSEGFTPPLPAYVAAAILVWVAAPAIAVLAGALPFLASGVRPQVSGFTSGSDSF